MIVPQTLYPKLCLVYFEMFRKLPTTTKLALVSVLGIAAILVMGPVMANHVSASSGEHYGKHNDGKHNDGKHNDGKHNDGKHNDGKHHHNKEHSHHKYNNKEESSNRKHEFSGKEQGQH